jgi:hypothetical protein
MPQAAVLMPQAALLVEVNEALGAPSQSQPSEKSPRILSFVTGTSGPQFDGE